ncbi:MAG TPA: lysyl oxidase family protein [Thermoanaerobaculia bacterium]
MRKTFAVALFVCLGLSASAFAQRTSVSGDFPVYANGGKPDLTLDPKRFVSQMEIVDRYFDADSCAFIEGSVGGTGYRRILRFDTVVINAGDGDLVIGDRSDPANPYAAYFEFSACHQHYHIHGFSTYYLLKASDRSVAVAGHKQGFCFTDSLRYGGGKSDGFSCSYQGITSGWGDWYYKQLTGQWIDISGIPEGDYIVQVTINDTPIFDEGENRYPNVVETAIHVPDPRNKVAIDNSP